MNPQIVVSVKNVPASISPQGLLIRCGQCIVANMTDMFVFADGRWCARLHVTSPGDASHLALHLRTWGMQAEPDLDSVVIAMPFVQLKLTKARSWTGSDSVAIRIW